MVKRAFETCVEDYARHRPGYPAELIEWLGKQVGHTGRAADIGAGTGIFTRMLAAAGWRVTAVEPSAEMLKCVLDGMAGAETRSRIAQVCASAEATGLSSGAFDLVTAAQAFHWFNPPIALREFARILRPGGVQALLWNNRDFDNSPFVREYEHLIRRFNPSYEREYRDQDWTSKIEETGLFSPAAHKQFQLEWCITIDGIIGFSRSVSYIRNVLSREALVEFEKELRALATSHFGGGPVRMPLKTDLWWATKRTL
jgi:SAM-dependent methyltransferase